MLTEKGVEQAKDAVQHFRDLDIIPDIVYASPLMRAMETALIAYACPNSQQVFVVSEIWEMDWACNYDNSATSQGKCNGKTSSCSWDQISTQRWKIFSAGDEDTCMAPPVQRCPAMSNYSEWDWQTSISWGMLLPQQTNHGLYPPDQFWSGKYSNQLDCLGSGRDGDWIAFLGEWVYEKLWRLPQGYTPRVPRQPDNKLEDPFWASLPEGGADRDYYTIAVVSHGDFMQSQWISWNGEKAEHPNNLGTYMTEMDMNEPYPRRASDISWTCVYNC
jgi:hypothetical protein